MRIRLTVQRNALPAAKILWNVPDTASTQAYTISRLLDDVNHVIPLESEHWGLEHYVVEIDGFECLHFSPVAEALKENDHVSIRPLLTAEVRARTLTGRDQITEDGRHLVDGVPFGRPFLRRAKRPDLRIPAAPEMPTRAPADTENEGPPQKRQRIMGSPESNGKGMPGLLTNGDSHRANQNGCNSRKGSKAVQFEELRAQIEDEDSEEDDEDFVPEGMDGNLDMDEASEEDSDFGTDSDSASSSNASSSDSDSELDSDDSDDSSSDSDGDSDASSAPEVQSSKGKLIGPPLPPPNPTQLVPPRQGRKATHARNARRTRTNRLRHLQESGKLPMTAGLKELQEYEDGQPEEDSSRSPKHQQFSNWNGKRKHINDEEEQSSALELELRKKELMTRFGEDVASTMVEIEETLQETTMENQTLSSQAQSVGGMHTVISPEKDTPRKRLRPDTSAISRIIARQAMPLTRKSKKATAVESAPPEPEGASDRDFWKTRINVSAFECWDEEFELGAPPFPFKQHWDPASKLMREKAERKKQKKGKKVVREPTPVEEEVEENIILDYDDAPESGAPESDINAAIEDQLQQDVATAAQQDLPPLPEDIGALASLVSGDIKVGAVIVCKFFQVNPVTVAPEISEFKTAIVEREGDSGNGAGTIRLKLAQRDLPKKEKKFDKKGNPIYNAADQFYMDDEDEEGIWEGQFSELLEPKLLQSA